MMKGIKFMLMYLAVAGLVFSSCGDDDTEDGDTLDAAAIVGKWKVTDMSTGVPTVDNQIKELLDSWVSDMFPNAQFEFTSDMKYTLTKWDGEAVEKGTYTVSGNELTVSYKSVQDGQETGSTKTRKMKLQVKNATELIWSDKLTEYSEYFGALNEYSKLLGDFSFKITLTKQQ